MHEGSVTFKFAVDVRELERLNRLVRLFGDLHEVPSRAQHAANLAIDEAVTNILMYGFADAAGHQVAVRIEAMPGELRCEITDGGREFNPLEAPVPDLSAALADRKPGGLGIHLLRSMMDGVEYRRADAKNVLTMRKRIR